MSDKGSESLEQHQEGSGRITRLVEGLTYENLADVSRASAELLHDTRNFGKSLGLPASSMQDFFEEDGPPFFEEKRKPNKLMMAISYGERSAQVDVVQDGDSLELKVFPEGKGEGKRQLNFVEANKLFMLKAVRKKAERAAIRKSMFSDAVTPESWSAALEHYDPHAMAILRMMCRAKCEHGFYVDVGSTLAVGKTSKVYEGEGAEKPAKKQKTEKKQGDEGRLVTEESESKTKAKEDKKKVTKKVKKTKETKKRKRSDD